MVSDRDQVKDFLLELKMTLSQDHRLVLDERNKNLRSLAMLGMFPAKCRWY